MKGYSAFPEVPALLEHQYQIVLYHIQDTHCMGWGSYFTAEKQSVISPVPADWDQRYLSGSQLGEEGDKQLYIYIYLTLYLPPSKYFSSGVYH